MLVDNPDGSWQLSLMAYKARERGDLLVALDYCIRAQKLDDSNLDSMMVHGSVLFLLGRYEEAAALYEEVVRRNPELWNAHVGLGASYLRLRRYQDAITELKLAIEMNGTVVEWYLDLAFAYSSQQQHEDAVDVVEAATRLGLSHPRLDLQRGYIAFAKDDLEGALDHFRRAEAGAPEETDIIYTVATTAQKLKKHLIARDAFKRAVSLRPEWQDALIGLARSEFALSNLTGGFEAMEKAFADNPKELQAVLEGESRALGNAETLKSYWSAKWRKSPSG